MRSKVKHFEINVKIMRWKSPNLRFKSKLWHKKFWHHFKIKSQTFKVQLNIRRQSNILHEKTKLWAGLFLPPTVLSSLSRMSTGMDQSGWNATFQWLSLQGLPSTKEPSTLEVSSTVANLQSHNWSLISWKLNPVTYSGSTSWVIFYLQLNASLPVCLG